MLPVYQIFEIIHHAKTDIYTEQIFQIQSHTTAKKCLKDIELYDYSNDALPKKKRFRSTFPDDDRASA